MKIVLYLLLVASLDSLAPAKGNSNPLSLNSGNDSVRMTDLSIPKSEAGLLNSEEGSTAPMRNQSGQRGSIAIRRFPTISFYYRLDDYKICYRDGSIVKVGSLDVTNEIEKIELRKITNEWEKRFGKVFDDSNSALFHEIFLKSEGNLVEIFENLKSDLAPSTAARFAFFLLYACNYDYELPNFTELQKNIESYLRNVYSRDDMTLKLKWFEQQRLSIIVFVSSACLLFDAIPSLAISLSTSPSHVNATSSMDGSISISCLPDNETNTSLCSGKFFGNQVFTFSAISYPIPGIGWWKIGVASCILCSQFFFPWFVNILFSYCTTSTTNDDNKMMKSASYLLAAYIICKESQSNKNRKDRFASEDFPCQVAIRNAVYFLKKSKAKASELSYLIPETIRRMK